MRKVILSFIGLAFIIATSVWAFDPPPDRLPDGTILAMGSSLMVAGGGVPSGDAAQSWEIEEDFTAIDDWTQQSGSWTLDSGRLDFPNEGLIYSDTNFANAFQQYAKFQPINAGDGCRVIFRLDANGDGYGIHFDFASNEVSWQAYDNYGHQAQIQSAESFTEDTWVGCEVYSTETAGNDSTEIRVWAWSTDPGDRDDWGAADVTLTSDPGSYVEDHTGTIAFQSYYTSTLVDNLSANSEAAP